MAVLIGKQFPLSHKAAAGPDTPIECIEIFQNRVIKRVSIVFVIQQNIRPCVSEFAFNGLLNDVSLIEKILFNNLKARLSVKLIKGTINENKIQKNRADQKDHPLFMDVLNKFKGEVLRQEKIMLKGMGNLYKQAQKMQENMAKVQKELEDLEIEGNSGGGVVKVVVNGKKDIKSINIQEEILKEDKNMIEDMVLAAVKNAMQKAEKIAEDKMKAVTGGILPGMNIPGL